MFVTRDQVQALTGYTVDQQVITTAQLMIETYVGKSESEVTKAEDLMTLSRATALQAAYVNTSGSLLLEQAAVKSIVANESTTVFDTAMLAPYMAPLAVLACRRLSWMGTRSVKVGSVFDVSARNHEWRRD